MHDRRNIHLASSEAVASATQAHVLNHACPCIHHFRTSHDFQVSVIIPLDVQNMCTGLFSSHQLCPPTFNYLFVLIRFNMSLPMRSLLLTAIFQPLFELNQLVTELRSVRASFQLLVPRMTRPEVADHVHTIVTHVDPRYYLLYESILQLAMADAQRILHLYTQDQWDVPPLHGPNWS